MYPDWIPHQIYSYCASSKKYDTYLKIIIDMCTVHHNGKGEASIASPNQIYGYGTEINLWSKYIA